MVLFKKKKMGCFGFTFVHIYESLDAGKSAVLKDKMSLEKIVVQYSLPSLSRSSSLVELLYYRPFLLNGFLQYIIQGNADSELSTVSEEPLFAIT